MFDITPEDIEANIEEEHYRTAADAITEQGAMTPSNYEKLRLTTICMMVLKNGLVVIGSHSFVNPDAFDADFGELHAREDAIGQVRRGMTYALKQAMFDAQSQELPPQGSEAA